MVSVDALLDAFRGKIVSDGWLSTYSMQKSDLRRANSEALNRGESPPPQKRAIYFSVEFDALDRHLNTFNGRLFVMAMNKELKTVEQMALDLIDSLHTYQVSNANLVLYACWYVGGPVLPEYNDQNATYEATLVFDIRVG